jgi:hypothetical protein
MNTLTIPTFENEADQFNWAYENREGLTRTLLQAENRKNLSGTLLQAVPGGRARLNPVTPKPRGGITRPTTIRLAPEEISRARTLAERRGLRYQTYLKMLIHEALEREERQTSVAAL